MVTTCNLSAYLSTWQPNRAHEICGATRENCGGTSKKKPMPRPLFSFSFPQSQSPPCLNPSFPHSCLPPRPRPLALRRPGAPTLTSSPCSGRRRLPAPAVPRHRLASAAPDRPLSGPRSTPLSLAPTPCSLCRRRCRCCRSLRRPPPLLPRLGPVKLRHIRGATGFRLSSAAPLPTATSSASPRPTTGFRPGTCRYASFCGQFVI